MNNSDLVKLLACRDGRSAARVLHLLLAIPRHHVSASHVHSSSIVHSRPTVRANGYGWIALRARRIGCPCQTLPPSMPPDSAAAMLQSSGICAEWCNRYTCTNSPPLWVRSRRGVCTVAAAHHTAVRATGSSILSAGLWRRVGLTLEGRQLQRRRAPYSRRLGGPCPIGTDCDDCPFRMRTGARQQRTAGINATASSAPAMIVSHTSSTRLRRHGGAETSSLGLPWRRRGPGLALVPSAARAAAAPPRAPPPPPTPGPAPQPPPEFPGGSMFTCRHVRLQLQWCVQRWWGR